MNTLNFNDVLNCVDQESQKELYCIIKEQEMDGPFVEQLNEENTISLFKNNFRLIMQYQDLKTKLEAKANEPVELQESQVNEDTIPQPKDLPLDWKFPEEKVPYLLRKMLESGDKDLDKKSIEKLKYLNPLVDIIYQELLQLDM